MGEDLTTRLAFAARLLREAGTRAVELFHRRGALTVERKGLQDLVSPADREIESLIRARIATAFPGDEVLGEEQGGAAAADRLWVVDPIDGTANFLRGLPYWCLTMAHLVRGRVELAVTYDPLRDELFEARRGAGAFRNDVPIRVAATTRPEEGCIGLAHKFTRGNEAYLGLLGALLEAGIDHRRMGSVALTLAHVADGRLDGLLSLSMNSWDVLAGLLLVREAGGVAVSGSEGLERPGPIAACTPALAPHLFPLVGLDPPPREVAATELRGG